MTRKVEDRLAARAGDLAARAVRRLSEVAQVPIALSDPSGRVLARAGPEEFFCPRLVHDVPGLQPLPRACEACERRIAHLTPCPLGVDAAVPVAGGGAAGWLSTAVMPRADASTVARAAGLMSIAAAPLGLALEISRREEIEAELIAARLLGLHGSIVAALDALPAAADASRAHLIAAQAALESARDLIESLRAKHSPGAEKTDSDARPASGHLPGRKGSHIGPAD